MKEIFYFIKTNWIVLLIASIALYFAKNLLEITGVLIDITLIECLALCLCGLANYAFTNIPFVKNILSGETSDIDKAGHYKILSNIFLGVHILVGLCVFGIYFLKFLPH